MVLALIFTIVSSVSVFIPLMPKIEQGVDDAIKYALDLYEDDLEITVKKGIMSVNKKEPYIIPLTESNPRSDIPKNLIVFDSKGTLEDMEEVYDTVVLINGVNILLRTERKTEVYSVSNIPDGTYTKNNFENAVNHVRSLAKYAPYFVGGALFIGTLFYYLIFRLIYLLFIAFILWGVGSIRGLALSYEKYYKVAIHSVTLPLTIEFLRRVLSLQFHFPSWFFLLNIIFGLIVVMNLNNDETSGVGETEVASETDGKTEGAVGEGDEKEAEKEVLEGEVIE